MMDPTDFAKRTAEFVPAQDGWTCIEPMIPLVQERVATLSETTAMVDFFFANDQELAYDADALAKVQKLDAAVAIVDDCVVAYRELAEAKIWTVESLHDATVAVGETHGLKLGKAQAPIRVALTGRTVGPPLFESVAVLGPNATLTRLQRFAAVLRDAKA
jgi:glutamyl-tRNA synthetase